MHPFKIRQPMFSTRNRLKAKWISASTIISIKSSNKMWFPSSADKSTEFQWDDRNNTWYIYQESGKIKQYASL